MSTKFNVKTFQGMILALQEYWANQGCTVVQPFDMEVGAGDVYKRQILGRFEAQGFRVVALKMVQLTKEQVEGFYAEHQGKPFFEPLVEYMLSGPMVVSVLEKENAVKDYRTLIGATNPAEAAEGTILSLIHIL